MYTLKRKSTTTDVFTSQEVAAFRKDTEGCAHVIHLNNAGAGLMPNIVTQATLEHLKLEASIGGYEAAALRADAIEQFYHSAARLINTKPHNIAFTASATDSFTRALSSIPFEPGDIILTDNDDFISNQIQFLASQKRFGIRIEHIRNHPVGGIDLEDFERKLYTLKPRLLAITHIPTNAGLVQPVAAIGEIYRRYRQEDANKTWYILDACQSIGQMKLDVQRLQCDFLSVTNRKFLRGPRGTGFLYIGDLALQSGLEPLYIDMRGAEWIAKDRYQPRDDAKRFEDWEFAYALVIGSRVAIDYCLDIGEDRIEQQVRTLSNYMREQLCSLRNLRILDQGLELGGLVTFTIANNTPQHLLKELSRHKINVVPSYRNFAVIDFDYKQVAWAIRASPHYYNTRREIDALVSTLDTIIR